MDQGTGRIEYTWLKLNIFTHWVPATSEPYLVIFDPAESVKDDILSSVTIPGQATLRDPYWIHTQ